MSDSSLINFNVITIFPEMFSAMKLGVVGRALENKVINLRCWNLREFSEDRFGRIDDRPYGGGPGMVMSAEPLQKAIAAAREGCVGSIKTIYLSPQGKRLSQEGIAQLAKNNNMILLAGRYEGIDERLIELEIDEEWSIGDYVLSGGELPAMVLIDAITRTLPGVLGDETSALQDSFVAGLLDYPHYTRPEVFAGMEVPKVLLSGDHKAIAKWRLQESLRRTWLRRPDLLQNRRLTKEVELLLNGIIFEENQN